MKLYSKLCLILIVIVYSWKAYTQQSLSLVSYYPDTALLVERGLPFAVIGPNDAFVKSVEIVNGNNCRKLIDPYYPKVFHLECKLRSTISITVLVGVPGSADVELTMRGIVIGVNDLSGGGWPTPSGGSF